jgi:hypothetical protein
VLLAPQLSTLSLLLLVEVPAAGLLQLLLFLLGAMAGPGFKLTPRALLRVLPALQAAAAAAVIQQAPTDLLAQTLATVAGVVRDRLQALVVMVPTALSLVVAAAVVVQASMALTPVPAAPAALVLSAFGAGNHELRNSQRSR